MFITPIAAMIFTVVLLIIACLTIYIVTKISELNLAYPVCFGF